MNGVRRKMVDVLVMELSAIPQKVIYCGHTHVRSMIWLPDGKMIINPGSVGLPAYYEEKPFPHAMESMTPHAEYGIARRSRDGWQFEHILVPYDWESAAKRAELNGRADYAFSIRTGRAAKEGNGN